MYQITFALLVGAAVCASSQRDHSDPAKVTAVALEDLKSVRSQTSFNAEQGQRYHDAVSHLQQISSRFKALGFLDRDKLAEAVQDFAFVTEHNPMPESLRSKLTKDLADLRNLRTRPVLPTKANHTAESDNPPPV